MSSERTFFHRTDEDRRPARVVVTAALMGDPEPDREARPEARRSRIVWTRGATHGRTVNRVAE